MANNVMAEGTVGTQGTNGEKENQKGLLQKGLDKAQRGWDKFRTSKGGRWAIRGTKLVLIGLGLKTAYDAGKKSVKPEMILVEPVTEEPEQPAETEEPAEEETKDEVE